MNSSQMDCRKKSSGNILFYILLGIVLLGTLTIALRNTGSGVDNMDKEDLILKSTQVQKYGSELAQSVSDLLASGVSEADIRFAHPDAPADYGTITTTPTNQIFAPTGGKAAYRSPPANINDGSPWEFFATTDVPEIGSDKADLIAVLPNVTEEFCAAINQQLGFTSGTQPTDSATGTTPDCVMGGSSDRFTGTFNDTTPNILDGTSFSRKPSLQACVQCASDGSYNYFYVLLAR